jgi:hypothetical protein
MIRKILTASLAALLLAVCLVWMVFLAWAGTGAFAAVF